MITSRDNETLKLVRKLLGQRRYREETGLFAAEGEDLVEAARLAGVEPVHHLVAGETVDCRAAGDRLHPSASRPRDRRLPASGSADRAARRVSRCGDSATRATSARWFARRTHSSACVAVSEGCADPLSPKALRASAGAIFRVPLVGWESAPGRKVALVAHAGAPLAEVDLSPPVTFLLGAERAGLPELGTDRHKATIALPGGAESLNVAAAGAIALYEASRRTPGSAPRSVPGSVPEGD